MWVCLTKYGVFNPFRVTKFAIKKKVFLLYYLNAWRYGWKQILFGRKYKMWCPIPSFATHMERDFLAPSIDWTDSFNKEIEKIRNK